MFVSPLSSYGYDDGRRVVDVDALTPRHLQIVCLVAEGAGNRSIAEELGISQHTVRAHLNVIYRVLNVGGQLAADKRLLLALLAAQDSRGTR